MRTAPSASARSTHRDAFRQLVLLSSRELFRNIKTVIALMFMFFFFLILMVGIDFVINGGRPAPVASVANGPHTAQVVEALRNRDIAVRAEDAATARITVEDDSARIVLVGKTKPAWKHLVAAVHSTGIPSADIVVTDASGEAETDILRVNLATVLVTGFMAIAFMGTSVPLVALRQRGTLRLLGTTPVRRMAFILAQSPVRLALGIAEAIVIVLIAWSQGYVESFNIVRLFVTLVLGLAMLFSFAYLLASRSANPDVTTQITGFLPVIVILTSGTVVPIDVFPDAVRSITYGFPSTWFMQAIGADIAGTDPFVSVYWLWLMMAAVGIAAALLAARLFKWDQGEL
ncbi:ABC transporter permease [Curtobacterium sp. MCBD17_035]|uniref:ABC transporter permease n=1 Tax=Curtobacterium sp. MCBD17_035 TaxID=2175673 RepID=UPI000DA7890E|nr:ABC transporter permease [Curtobacterium sp. MCBD17_035]WIB68108.1 ABC transporter permease [Curtobacterium sp. MCBD17_035]